MTAELIIVPVFWILLNSKSLYSKNNVLTSVAMAGEHSLGMVLLLIDYSINNVPFTIRHNYIITIFVAIYFLLNFWITKASGHPIYPPFDWNSMQGYLLPIIVLVWSFLLNILMRCLSHYKIKNNGNLIFLDALYGNLKASQQSLTPG